MKRYIKNPIITRENIPDIKPHLSDVTSVFNPGAVKFNDEIILLLRVQNRGRETFLLTAKSSSGIDFQYSNKKINFKGIEKVKDKIYHIYDPRITKLENVFYITVAMDMDKGCYIGLIKTNDFEEFEFLGIISNGESRNGVIFPEKVNGRYLMLERPNKKSTEGGVKSGEEIVISESENMIDWKMINTVMQGRFHYWDELIGSGPPPVKTKHGWLHIYHGIALHYQPIYQPGAVILDLQEPWKVIARTKYNILEPRELYETGGQVPNVVFPTGMIVEKFDGENFATDDSEVKIYYGAADTSVCLCTSTIMELINLCRE